MRSRWAAGLRGCRRICLGASREEQQGTAEGRRWDEATEDHAPDPMNAAGCIRSRNDTDADLAHHDSESAPGVAGVVVATFELPRPHAERETTVILTFQFQPVDDLHAAVQHYLDLGWEEAWREGEHTVSLQMPELEIELMLDDEPGWGPAGPMYFVDNVDAWRAEHPTVTTGEPREIPGGRVVEVTAPGHTYYVFSVEEVEG